MRPVDHRQFKDRVYAQFARMTAALASPRCLEIIDLLAQGEWSVEALARLSELSVATTSRHLQVLKAARLVEVRRDGPYAYYRLADGRLFRAWQAIRELGEARLLELDHVVRTLLEAGSGEEEPVTADELAERLERGDVVVVDARSEEEYRAGHIPGAVSAPVARLGPALKALPRDREVIAYGRAPYCVCADEAVARLREHGFRARRLMIGLPDWAVAGRLVE